MAKRESRTIKHSLFYYETEEGGQAIAMRNETVDLLPGDIERGEKHDAFTAAAGELPEPVGTLGDFPSEGTEAEQDAWVLAAKVGEAVDAVRERPEILDAVLAAEQRRGDAARKTLVEALAAGSGS